MFETENIKEEHFGILTDDDLALEATLVRPGMLTDDRVQTVQVWVPKFPLTRSSVLPAARAEIEAVGSGSRMVNLTFDLRGSGESDGTPSDEGFEIDLHSAHEWAKERFGPDVVFRTLGFPDLGGADRLLAYPLRPGVVAELYRYNPDEESKGRVLYFSSYGDFDRADDALCRALARADYTVYGGDLLRYLFMAGPLTPEELRSDGVALGTLVGEPFYLIARAFAAGPALAIAAGNPAVGGVIVTGPAQEGLNAPHLFSQDDPAKLDLSLLIKNLSPRPAVYLWNRAEVGRVTADGLQRIHMQTGKPSLWGAVREINASILLHALDWVQKNQQMV
jgi:hypothetical protein